MWHYMMRLHRIDTYLEVPWRSRCLVDWLFNAIWKVNRSLQKAQVTLSHSLLLNKIWGCLSRLPGKIEGL